MFKLTENQNPTVSQQLWTIVSYGQQVSSVGKRSRSCCFGYMQAPTSSTWYQRQCQTHGPISPLDARAWPVYLLSSMAWGVVDGLWLCDLCAIGVKKYSGDGYKSCLEYHDLEWNCTLENSCGNASTVSGR